MLDNSLSSSLNSFYKRNTIIIIIMMMIIIIIIIIMIIMMMMMINELLLSLAILTNSELICSTFFSKLKVSSSLALV